MYRPLPHERCTRLLTFVSLASENNRNDLCLRLSVIDIDNVKPCDFARGNAKQYQALSYTWGSPVSDPDHEERYGHAFDVQVSILVGEQQYSHKIGRNLFEALLQIRDMDYNRPLWVDALCINQDDLREKETHIVLMGAIYAKAQRVIAWLGRDLYDDFDDIIWWHEEFLEKLDDHQSETGKAPVDTDFIDHGPWYDGTGIMFRPAKCFASRSRISALVRFWGHRRWFTRSWVQQEVQIPRVVVVLLGDHQLALYRVGLLALWLHPLEERLRRYDQTAGLRMRVAQGVERIVHSMHNRQWRDNHTADRIQSLVGRHTPAQVPSAVLEYMLETGFRLDATDPRDHIYSLFGIMTQIFGIRPPLKPDYGISTQDLFIKLTKQQLRYLPHRAVLSLVGERREHAAYAAHLPSWVPDYANECSMWNAKTAYNLSAVLPTTSGPHYFSFDGNKLNLFARRCSVVTMALPQTLDSKGYLGDIRQKIEILRFCQQLRDNGMADLFPSLFRTTCLGAPHISDDQDFCTVYRSGLIHTRVMLDQLPASAEINAFAASLDEIYRDLAGSTAIPSDQDLQLGRELDRITNLALHASSERETQKLGYDSILAASKLWPDTRYDEDTHNMCVKYIMENMTDSKGGIHSTSAYKDFSEQLVATFGSLEAVTIPSVMSIAYSGGMPGSVWEAFGRCMIQLATQRWLETVKQLSARMAQRATMKFGPATTYFVTEDRCVGRIPVSSVEAGDELWLICRAKQPFIMRPLGNGEYKLLGEAYVQGGMDNELERNGTAGAAQRITLV